MDRAEVYKKLNQVFVDVFDDDDIVLRPEMASSDVFGWDSLNHMRLIATIEKEFVIKFSTAEATKAKNVGEFVDIILSKRPSL